mgnify:CR=1 FL=1
MNLIFFLLLFNMNCGLTHSSYFNQGCLVALLYCFFNHEVQIELKKLWLSCKQHFLNRHFSLGYNHSTMSGNGNNGQQPHTTNHQTNNLSSRITKHSLMSNCSSFFRREVCFL